MLKISIKNYKCWDNYKTEIPIGTVTLIKGDSGCGKTTIFNAIFWCLYDGIIKDFAPKNKTSVTLQFPCIYYGVEDDIIVTRKRNPKLFEIVHGGKKYTNDVAQSLINQLFGDKDLWLSCCYVQQNSRNHFLSSKNADRIKLLHRLAFRDDDPSKNIQQIDKYVIKLQDELTNDLHKFSYELKYFTETYTGIDFQSSQLTNDDFASIQNEIRNLSSKLNELTIKNTEYIANNKLLKMLENKYNSIVFPGTPKFNTIIDLSLDNEKIILAMKERDILMTQMAKISGQFELDDQDFTENDYKNSIVLENTYNSNKNKCVKLGIKYTEENIQESINLYRIVLNDQKYLSIQKVIDELNKNIVNTEKAILELDKKIIQEEEKIKGLPKNEDINSKLEEMIREHGELGVHLKHLETTKDLKTCPHCHGSIRIIASDVHKADQKPADPMELQNLRLRLNTLSKLIKDHQTLLSGNNSMILKLTNDINKYKNDINNLANKQKQYQEKLLENEMRIKECEKPLSNKILGQEEMAGYMNAINYLESIEIIEEPKYSSIHIKNNRDYKGMQEKVKILDKKIPDIYKDIKSKDLESDLFKINEYIKNKEKMEEMKMMIGGQIEEIKNKIFVDPSAELKDVEIQIMEMKEKIKKHQMAEKAAKAYAQLEQNRAILVEREIDIKYLRELKKKSEETEEEILDRIINDINVTMENICAGIFESDFNISLSLFKKLKTDDRLKRETNFSIYYKGNTYTDMNELSGGEGDRASLALTLSLNKLYNCPFLMFDESLGSLDINTKECVISAIKELTEQSGKTILVIMHDGIEGVYDHIVDVQQH